MDATQKQLNFIRKLATERALTEDQRHWLDAELSRTISRSRASQIIDKLLAVGKAAPAADAENDPAIAALRSVQALVPAGRYAIVVQSADQVIFYEVDKPTRGRWAGRVFVTKLVGENHEPVRNVGAKVAVLEVIATDVEGAARRYGHHKQHCGFCRQNLTDRFSRFFGVGPVCRRRHGMAISEAAYRRNATPALLVDLDNWIAEDVRIEQKNEFAAYEREQEEKAYRLKMRRDEQLFDNPPTT